MVGWKGLHAWGPTPAGAQTPNPGGGRTGSKPSTPKPSLPSPAVHMHMPTQQPFSHVTATNRSSTDLQRWAVGNHRCYARSTESVNDPPRGPAKLEMASRHTTTRTSSTTGGGSTSTPHSLPLPTRPAAPPAKQARIVHRHAALPHHHAVNTPGSSRPGVQEDWRSGAVSCLAAAAVLLSQPGDSIAQEAFDGRSPLVGGLGWVCSTGWISPTHTGVWHRFGCGHARLSCSPIHSCCPYLCRRPPCPSSPHAIPTT